MGGGVGPFVRAPPKTTTFLMSPLNDIMTWSAFIGLDLFPCKMHIVAFCLEKPVFKESPQILFGQRESAGTQMVFGIDRGSRKPRSLLGK